MKRLSKSDTIPSESNPAHPTVNMMVVEAEQVMERSRPPNL